MSKRTVLSAVFFVHVLFSPIRPAQAVTYEECEDRRLDCEKGCRNLPAGAKVERQRCWSQCNENFANCIRKIK